MRNLDRSSQFLDEEASLTMYHRRICDVGFWKTDQMTDETFLRSRQLPSFRIFWARHRLNYLQHVAQHGAVFHKALLHLEWLTNTSWLTELQDDLAWPQSLHSLPFAMPTDRPTWVDSWETLPPCNHYSPGSKRPVGNICSKRRLLGRSATCMIKFWPSFNLQACGY